MSVKFDVVRISGNEVACEMNLELKVGSDLNFGVTRPFEVSSFSDRDLMPFSLKVALRPVNSLSSFTVQTLTESTLTGTTQAFGVVTHGLECVVWSSSSFSHGRNLKDPDCGEAISKLSSHDSISLSGFDKIR